MFYPIIDRYTKARTDVERMQQQLFAARSQIAKLQEDLYKAHLTLEKTMKERRTGRIRVYTKGLLNEAKFMHFYNEETVDIVYEDDKYIKLEPPELVSQYSYKVYEKYHGDIY